MSFRVVIAIATAVVSLMAAKAGFGSETKLKKSTYWAASFLLFLITLVSAYDEYRPWGISEKQSSALEDFACSRLSNHRFPMFVFDLGSVPESNPLAIRIRDIFRECGWSRVSLWPGDGWLRQDKVGIQIVWSPEPQNDAYRQLGQELSGAFRMAAIDHKLGTHSRLQHHPVKVGVVVGARPAILEHVFGYGTR